MTASKRSAGLLVYRRRADRLEVLLAHPGGPFWAKKDDGAWTVPKGLAEGDEDLLTAAEREFAEEMGTPPPRGERMPLEPIRQTGGKTVHAWAVEGDFDPAALKSNRFSIEWPPRSGRQREFPEVDRAAWFPIEEARRKIVAGQVPLLAELEEKLVRGDAT